MRRFSSPPKAGSCLTITISRFFSSVKQTKRLRDKIVNEFSEWIKPAAKPFLPHLTVKRFQHYEYDQLKSLIDQHPFPTQSFTVKKFSLLKSERNQIGQKYHIIHSTEFSSLSGTTHL
jgi:2'-5' RNA ligase